MNRNFLILAWRNMKRNKVFSFLNIGGLAIGIAACVVSLLFVKNEFDFDRFHSKGDRIYRLNEVQRFEGMTEQLVPLSMFPMAEALTKDYPQVEEAVRIGHNDDITLRNGSKQVLASKIINADSNFFRVFDFKLIHGDIKSALSEPTSIVITESLARNLFGKSDVQGEMLAVNRYGNFENFKISAVLADITPNSHLQFEGILPMRSIRMQSWMNTWDANWVNTYLLLKNSGDDKILTSRLNDFEKKYLGEQDASYTLYLQPLHAIHLDSGAITHDESNNKKFSRSYVNIFLSIALFVLLIAVLNFINLATARAAQRAREVGVRKTIGAGRWQLIRQFIAESVLVAALAFLISLGIVHFSLPFINSIIDREMSLTSTMTPLIWLGFILSAIVLGIVAGIYPALVLSSYKPVKVLKGIIRQKPAGGISIRNSLVVAQFAIATVLIVSTLVMVQQLGFIRKRDIGFDKEQVMIVSMNATSNKQYQHMKTELQKNALIADVTAYNSRLGNNIGQMGAKYLTETGEEKKVSVSHLVVDQNYLDFFDIKINKGRGFSPAFSDTAGRSYIINETLAKELNTKEVIGVPYKAAWLQDMGKIVGVVKDFNFNSLHNKIEPLYISMQNWSYNEMAIKLKPGSIDQGIAIVKQLWDQNVTDMPLHYTFLDEHLNTLYKADAQVSKVVSILTALAIIIACLGLFGMAIFLIQTRIKEIGIRKVMGASVTGIIGMLSRDFLKPVVVSLIISLPLAWYFTTRWLEDFAYRISLNWWLFALAAVISILIALATISVQAVRAAVSNPVKSLRTE